jgi:outer membrane protein assembly factor BamB
VVAFNTSLESYRAGPASFPPGGPSAGAEEAVPVTDHLVGLSTTTGQQLWVHALRPNAASAFRDGQTVVVSNSDGSLIRVDANTGGTRWSKAVPRTCSTT